MLKERKMLSWIIAGAFLLIGLAFCLFALYDADSSDISNRKAREMLEKISVMAADQASLAAGGEGVAARNALNLQVKAQYALFKAQYDKFKPKAKLTLPLKKLIKETYDILLAANSREKGEELLEESGSRLRAYISPIDGTVQTYSVSVPKNYDAQAKWPLIVSLHGHGWYGRFQGHPAPQYSGAICLSPQGRGSTDYKEIGEDDVMSAIEEVKRDFNIDEDRVYLTGTSMGGTGSFSIATHFADQFAAIMPICGNADNEAWSLRWGWNRKYPGRNDKLRKALQDRNNPRHCAENLLMLPVFIIAGSADTVVPVQHSRSMVEFLRSFNANVQYREFPNCGHGGYPKESLADALAWTCSWKRNPEPPSIYWKAARLRHGKAWWTRMEQFAKPLEPGLIKADASPGKITVHTSNLLAFSLRRPSSVCGNGAITLQVDGKVLQLRSNIEAGTWMTLRKDPIHGWLDAVDAKRPELVKMAGLEGPIDDALRAPFVVVVGTTASSNETVNAWRREAEAFVKEWERRNGAPCRIMDDKDCKAEDMQKYNLILFGGARDNMVSELLASFIPLAGVTSLLPAREEDPDNGPGSLESRDLGSFILYPNTEYAPQRLVAMISANSPASIFQCWGRFGNWFNWGVHDSSKYFDYAIYDAHSVSPETMLIVGWFGTDWSIENGVYYLGNEKLRKETPPQKYPDVENAMDFDANELPLTRLMPEKIQQMRGAIALGRGFFGDALDADNAIGMRAPCVIEYNLNGAFKDFTSQVALIPAREMTLMDARRKSEKVSFKVFGDGRLLAEQVVSWEEPEADVSAIVSGVKQLRLEATPAGGPSWQHSGCAWLKPTLKR